MRIFHGINEYLKARADGEISGGQSAVTLGKFDGVHLGHQKLLKKILEEESRGLTGIMFAIDSGAQRILSENERAGFVSDFGIDILIECPFSRKLMTTSPEDFASGVLKDMLNASFVTVGTDFRFGYRRAGNASILAGLGERFGYRTDAVEKAKLFGEEISSTRVRAALEDGDMALAEALLGRPYPVWGKVVHGRQLGRTIGIPTANVIPDKGKLLPPDGVYASVTVLQDGRTFPGVTNIGRNPTIGMDNIRSCETNLFGLSEEIYDTFIRTQLVCRLRGEMRFGSVSELAEQMNKDRQKSLTVLKEREKVFPEGGSPIVLTASHILQEE